MEVLRLQLVRIVSLSRFLHFRLLSKARAVLPSVETSASSSLRNRLLDLLKNIRAKKMKFGLNVELPKNYRPTKFCCNRLRVSEGVGKTGRPHGTHVNLNNSVMVGAGKMKFGRNIKFHKFYRFVKFRRNHLKGYREVTVKFVEIYCKT